MLNLFTTLRLNPSLSFKQYHLDSSKLLWSDISTSKIRPIIAETFREKNLQCRSSWSEKYSKTIASRFIWTNIRKDINHERKSWVDCQKIKKNSHTYSPFATFKETDEIFRVNHIGIIGPITPSEEKLYCLTCIDRFTCWTEVVLLKMWRHQQLLKHFMTNEFSAYSTQYNNVSRNRAQNTIKWIH